ncbi:MAG: acetyltransferase [Sphaerochaetaceae bacterium]
MYIRGGGAGKELSELALETQKWEQVSFVDDITSNKTIHELPVFTLNEAISNSKNETSEFVIGVGEPRSREILFNKLKKYNCSIITLYAPSAVVSPKTQVSEGVVIHRGSTITCDGYIGHGSYINKHAVIGHDVTIGNFSVISPNVTISGNVNIGSYTYIGSGALIREGVTIGDNVIIGMGSVVLKDVPDKSVMVGNPAKKLRENISGKVFH